MFRLRNSAVIFAAGVGAAWALATVADLPVRTRAGDAGGPWKTRVEKVSVDPARLALVVCDMWDRHWCQAASERTAFLAQKAAPVIDLARERGVLIIHAPSDTMDYYKNHPQRRRAMELPRTDPPDPKVIDEPPLPIDDSDGGCDTPNNPQPVDFKAWTRQHPAIRIGAGDLISDNGREVYNALAQRGIKDLLVMGVHANMCILNRSFAIRQMTRWGIRCILVRDLTDAMYNPLRAPYVSHERGTELVIEHIEKYWAGSITSSELAAALRK